MVRLLVLAAGFPRPSVSTAVPSSSGRGVLVALDLVIRLGIRLRLVPKDFSSQLPMESPQLYTYAMTRAKAILGRLPDCILVDIYSSKNILNVNDLSRVHQTALECNPELENMTETLPPYVHFFDNSLPIGEGWQGAQRVILGNHYYLVQMLMRPQQLDSRIVGVR